MFHYFSEVDDCILAAYQHVKNTGSKVISYSEEDEDGYQVLVGVKSEDGHYFIMLKTDHEISKKRSLAGLIIKSGITVIDIINKQLIVFL